MARSVLAPALLTAVLLPMLPGRPAAQFNGDFTIARHRLADENFLDWQAYQPPLPWRLEWELARNALRASVGSISEERFYQGVELKFAKDLGRYATVLYEQHESSFVRPQPVLQQVELRFGERFYGSVLGWTQHVKSEGSMGMAVAYNTPDAPVFLRYSHLDQFVLFNQRGETDDIFSPIPTMDRVQFRYFAEGGLRLQGDMRREPPARLKVAEPPQSLTYSGYEYELLLFWQSRQGWSAGLNRFDDMERRGRTALAATAGSEAAQTMRLYWLDLFWRHELGPKDVMTLGWLDSAFTNAIDSEDPEERYRFRLFTAQVYGRWEHRQSEWVRWHYSLQIGNTHLFESPARIPSNEENGDLTQAKAGVGIALVELGSYQLLFNTTWDIDIIAKRQWDGGNVQLNMFF